MAKAKTAVAPKPKKKTSKATKAVTLKAAPKGAKKEKPSKKSKADEPDQCVNKYCSPNGFETVDSAKKFATIGQWVGIGGVLLTAVGATLIITAPSGTETGKARPRRSKGIAAGAFVAPGGGGLSVAGSL